MSTEEKLAAWADGLELRAKFLSEADEDDWREEAGASVSVMNGAAAELRRLSAEVQELRAERDMAEMAAAEAAIPLEALMMAGQGYLSDAVWDGVRNGVGHVRSMLAARAKRRAALKPETGK